MAGYVDDMLRIVTVDIASYDVFYKKLIGAVALKNVTSFCDGKDQAGAGAERRLEIFIVASSGYAAGCGRVNFNRSSKFTIR